MGLARFEVRKDINGSDAVRSRRTDGLQMLDIAFVLLPELLRNDRGGTGGLAH